jgi:hypothetical protein
VIMLIRYVTSQNSMKLVSVQFGTFLHRRAGSGGTPPGVLRYGRRDEKVRGERDFDALFVGQKPAKVLL